MIHINGFFHEITKAKSKSELPIRLVALVVGKNMRNFTFSETEGFSRQIRGAKLIGLNMLIFKISILVRKKGIL
jgi:hypothetical protein